MKAFAALFAALDATTATGAKIAALADYFANAPDEDRLWTLALFTGRRPRRVISATDLRAWAAEAAALPLWMFEEAYAVAGDLAETVTLVLPRPQTTVTRSLTGWIAELARIGTLEPPLRRAPILAAWDGLAGTERLLFTKLLTGGFRVGVAQGLVIKGLARALVMDEAGLTHRLMGQWSPATTTFPALMQGGDATAAAARPYPFALAPALTDPGLITDPADWAAEYKWDGIRGQLILRGGTHFLWSRGEDLITDSFPEFARSADWLPDGTVLDGEVLVWGDGIPRSFNALQARIGRKAPSRKLLADAPVVLLAYDLLEDRGEDIRALPYDQRRARLAGLITPLPADAPLRVAPPLTATTIPDLRAARENARAQGAEGLMLKRRDAPYHAGRKTGSWWKWKLDPFTVDAVMVYAQAGHGRRADLFTDYTFAVWHDGALVPVTKAYSGLTDAEFTTVTSWVRSHTLQRFGPVRQVTPELVFEIAFECLQPSPRHKAGLALRFPRMLRWRRDKPASEAGTLAELHAMLASLTQATQ